MARIAAFAGACFISSLTVGEAQASPRPYRYVSLDQALLPDSLFVDYFGLAGGRRVFGNSWACPSSCIPSIVVYDHGNTRLVHGGLGYAVNQGGTVGGSILTDPEKFIEQAALFKGKNVELLPRLPNEYSSHVLKLTNDGLALVVSQDAESVPTYYLYDGGRTQVLSFGGDVDHLDLDEQGLVSGTLSTATQQRAFRHNPKKGTTTILNPLPTETASWGQAIDNSENVLGYSFIPGGLERIGTWDRAGTFHTLFVEGTPQVPTISNRLLGNEAGLVVITNTDSEDQNSYIVPRAGVRQKLADITDGPLPSWTTIAAVNNQGDLLGSGGSSYFFSEHAFLLERR